ncbi:MAG: hypothetical protein Kow0090_17760 [Myxococcota bacterium]
MAKRGKGAPARARSAGSGDVKLEFRAAIHKILYKSNIGNARAEFVGEILSSLTDCFACEEVELVLKEGERQFHFLRKKEHSEHRYLDFAGSGDGAKSAAFARQRSYFDKIVEIMQRVSGSEPDISLPLFVKINNLGNGEAAGKGAGYMSTVLLPFSFGGENIGILEMKSDKAGFFNESEIELYASLAETLGIAFAHQRSQFELRERLKELSCVYEITKLVSAANISLDEFFQKALALTTQAMLHPKIAAGRVIFDGKVFQTPNFQDSSPKLSADIKVGGVTRGSFEILYVSDAPEEDSGPFLNEEINLIETMGREISLLIEKSALEEDRLKLETQLFHADRLTLFGRLAAGIAHELNEPLSGVLGFAQLALKNPGVPPKAQNDIQKIVATSLHAREIVKKLLFFAKQMPLKKTAVNLNEIVKESLFLLDNKLSKNNVECACEFSDELPEIYADPIQINQMVVNLVVNGVQAMPNGGRLTISTKADDKNVCLIIEDTGIGMSEEVKSKIFLPFFTTKDINEGTGLGLSVVHGIIKAHNGAISVKSELGKGSRFEVTLPYTGESDNE